MKKALVCLIFTLALSHSTFAQNIVGLWEIEKIESFENDTLAYTDLENEKCQSSIQFKENGKVVIKAFDEDCNPENEITAEYLNSLQALIIRYPDREEKGIVLFSDPNHMQMIQVFEYDDYTQRMVVHLTRKSR